MKISIINSSGHWSKGWVINQKELKVMIGSLERNGFEPEIHEVSDLKSLEILLQDHDPKTLILPNAYKVNRFKDSPETVWMVDIIERFNLPAIGSRRQTIQNVIQKDVCQKILKENGIPIPEFAVISHKDLDNVKAILDASNISYPAIVKLTDEASSIGISEDSLVYNQKQAIAQIQTAIKFYKTSAIIEDFLPSDDITTAYFPGVDDQPILLSTHYKISAKPGKTAILGRAERLMDWSESKTMSLVNEEFILKQTKELIPKVCKVLDINDVTRVDARLDKNGQLRIFDVNGFPGLSFPDSVIVVQAFRCFPSYSRQAVYDALINTIIVCAARRYNLQTSEQAEKHNFFTMNQN